MTDRRHVVIWLSAVCAVVWAMIVVGGITRLTQSGLSMVDWRPIMGVIPPMTEAEWQATFEAYRQYPEYQKINRGMSLEEFKDIFFWEYFHRVLGRIIGLVYFVPFVVFLALKKIESQWQPRLWIALVLGGLQGLMGWYMVKSGLVDVPHVSHYRLAAHLLLAILILGFLFWLILDMREVKRGRGTPGIYKLSLGLMILLSLQLLFGAFTAGLDAGYAFNTYPLMGDKLIADAAFRYEPFWRNIIENDMMIQFIHRWLGALLLAGIALLTWQSMKHQELRVPALLLAAVTLAQFLIGVMTLVMRVPVGLGSLHQAVAALLVLALLYFVYINRPGSRQK